jgi:hypothetical protein
MSDNDATYAADLMVNLAWRLLHEGKLKNIQLDYGNCMKLPPFQDIIRVATDRLKPDNLYFDSVKKWGGTSDFSLAHNEVVMQPSSRDVWSAARGAG